MSFTSPATTKRVTLAFLVLSALIALALAENAKGPGVTILLTADGFSPREVTIARGETLTFRTTRNAPFWPASDIHPTHTILPDFDPREPIDPKERWSFRFEKPGRFRYHDHLAPFFTGTVIVTAEDEQALSQNPCRGNDASAQLRCWRDQIEAMLERDGMDAAFETLARLYEAEPSFAANCHGYVHTLGQAAYRKFSQREPLALTPKTSYCGYGFFHGFMETLLHSGGNIREAREFCAEVDRQLSSQTGGAPGACLHGIGHGAVDGSDPRLWGDAERLIQPGLALCELVGADDREVDRCASGVFNSLAISNTNKQYGVALDPDHPYAICEDETKHYFKKPCYEEMNTTVFLTNGRDFLKAARLVENIRPDSYAVIAIQSLAGYAVAPRNSPGDPEGFIQVCQMLQPRLKLPCIQGFAAGLVEFGPPDIEYESALAFCRSGMLSREEADGCMWRILAYFSVIYPREKIDRICSLVEDRYKKYCPQS